MVEAEDHAMSEGGKDAAVTTIKKIPYVSKGRDEPSKADMLKYLTCFLCKGVYRDAHTINECMCTFCRNCIVSYFQESNTRSKCPNCKHDIGGKVFDKIIKDVTLQNITDWVLPQFKERED